MPTTLVTGATGFVGSHAAERAKSLGHTVRTLTRPSSDLTYPRQLGLEVIPGDMTDPAAVKQACAGADYVVHCAAKVGDWGPVDEYRSVNVEGLRVLLEAVKGTPLKRFVLVSSLGVYAARHHHGTDEAEPLPKFHIDGYTQSKVEAETLALEYVRQHRVPVAIVRPGFIYGPRDRTVLPRITTRLKDKTVIYIAPGQYALNTTYVGNLVDAIFLAAENPKAVGEVFNVTDGEFVSKRRFFESIADGLGLPRPRRSVPLRLAKFLANWRERVYRRQNRPNPPRVTQAQVKFAGLNLDFCIAKARSVLGYEPKTGFAEGMAAAIAWAKKNAR